MRKNNGFILAECLVGFFCLATYIVLLASSIYITNEHKQKVEEQVKALDNIYTEVLKRDKYSYIEECEMISESKVCYVK